MVDLFLGVLGPLVSLVALMLLILVVLAAASLFLLFHPLRPLRVSSRFPMPPRGGASTSSGARSWWSGTLDGIPFLVEEGMPYPTTFSSTSRPRISLDGPWQLRFGDEAWMDTAVPSVYNAARGGRTDYQGIVWYRREFEVATPGLGTESYIPRLCFEAVLLRGEVWLNDRSLGTFEGGYTPHYFDAPSLKVGSNTLLVRTDNRLTPDSLPPQPLSRHNPGWHTYGGIYRSVFIHFLPPHHLVKASFRIADLGGALDVEAISVEPHSSGAQGVASLSCSLSFRGEAVADFQLSPGSLLSLDPGGRIISHGPQGLRAWKGRVVVPSLRPWSPSAPGVYRADFTLSCGGWADRASVETGFRTFTVESQGFLLNGAALFLKGISKHEDHPELGPVQTEETIARDLDLVEELGANYLRLAHYPHHTAELNAARDRGILLSAEIPLYQAGTGFAAWFQEKRSLWEFPARLFGLRHMARRGLLDNARRQLLEMIERDRNNPALLFWSVGNECYSLGRRSGRLFSLLAETARYFDPSRPVTYVDLTYHIPYFDKRARGWAGMDFYCLNSYFGWYYGETKHLRAFLDDKRRRWPDKPLLLSEFGADAALGRVDGDGVWQAERVPPGKTYSESYQSALLGAYCDIASQRPYIAGVSPWVFADFYNTWFPNNPVPNYNMKGLLSADREKKAGFYTLQEIYRAWKV